MRPRPGLRPRKAPRIPTPDCPEPPGSGRYDQARSASHIRDDRVVSRYVPSDEFTHTSLLDGDIDASVF